MNNQIIDFGLQITIGKTFPHWSKTEKEFVQKYIFLKLFQHSDR